mmetsp:Transcript_1190/g.1680  ORF Transcript_1190/g.1680 Transcript_1190/m.1680 type:complete len:631 (-) Transcript_1190:150-2042(-)|eukprot:CAMPEP_0196588410 /NCGR_PEP_ID=MMETSP1081-20130531/60449_1 /TAXON_ID=36882 /ORGANISM="Pyramimonas amylifera, Strain CCMP720" /LENGTH=630 /DNA_ID=CAMNT_0041910893 /DNA_START=164 /DNA_END=2056 /DNA_ORIENTATION=+
MSTTLKRKRNEIDKSKDECARLASFVPSERCSDTWSIYEVDDNASVHALFRFRFRLSYFETRSMDNKQLSHEDSKDVYEEHLEEHSEDELVPEIYSLLYFRGEVVTLPAPKLGSSTQAPIGILAGTIIDRDEMGSDGVNFYQVGDSVSQDLKSITCAVADVKGRIRSKRVDGFDRKESYSELCNKGGFIHLEEVSLDKEYQGKDLGLRFTQAFFKWLEGKWTFAVLNPTPLLTPTEQRSKGKPLFDESLRHQSKVKISKQFSRLGFTQASQLNTLWWLIPQRLTFKSKEEVKTPQVWRLPKAAPLTAKDEELRTLMDEGVQKILSVAQWQAKVRACMASGASMTSSLPLHVAVSCGISDPDSLRLLIELGADVNQVDEVLSTPLHCAEHASNLVAITSLLQCGASLDARDLQGRTPRIIAEDLIQKTRDFYACFNIRKCCVQNYDVLLASLKESEKQILIDGVLSPRAHFILSSVAVLAADEGLNDMPDFEERVPLPNHEFLLVSWWEFIPKKILKGRIHKSFAHGWVQCIRAISEVLDRDLLPTVERLIAELNSGSIYNDKYTKFFLGHGGRVEFAIDALLNQATSELDNLMETFEEDIESLPDFPGLDDGFGYLRHKLLGDDFVRGPT